MPQLLAGGVGIPLVRWFGTDGEHNAMVLDHLGPSLENLINLSSRTFSLKTVLLLVYHLLSCLEYIHIKAFLHYDIRPGHVVVGIGQA
ncbi:uncharacterized protein SPSK_05745 [Sporothrix schenckii 1099-18]|uniref:Protein kinase domain-containing protein n=2 Tax=Sporothrix schenckii TaxID=29908 RepID=U7Q4L6_SPOS1|nr:uncharacterized protein SPSK_05745 [Sporothrix schenckii 1099-18]ERT01935.1 hypothetical protein HMPREF1624_00230 [Sporothrix schenckii ATCC 58251]KJR80908.1 hypothetical protein SPSK_05745 [Sporothrix schenckii 1099-18]